MTPLWPYANSFVKTNIFFCLPIRPRHESRALWIFAIELTAWGLLRLSLSFSRTSSSPLPAIDLLSLEGICRSYSRHLVFSLFHISSTRLLLSLTCMFSVYYHLPSASRFSHDFSFPIVPLIDASFCARITKKIIRFDRGQE